LNIKNKIIEGDVRMSLTILRAGYWKEKLFKKNNRNNSKVDLPSFLEEEEIEKRKILKEKSSQLEEISGKEYRMFLTRQIEKERWTRKRHIENGLNKATNQLLEIYNYHREETLDFLKNLFEEQPQFVEDIIKLKKGLESNVEGLQEEGKIGDDSKEQVGREETEENNKKTSKKELDTDDKKEKMGMSDIVGPLTQEGWKGQPKTIRDFLEQSDIKKVERTPRVTDKEREARFLRALKNLERYLPSYKPENKEKALDLLSKILKRPDIEKREEIQKRIKALIDHTKLK
jgi:hypothetical protein